MTCEIKVICRVCLQCVLDCAGGVSNIFAMNDKYFIYEKLNSIAEVNIKPGDGLPDKICAECLLELENAINFKQKCETSNSILLSAACAEDGLKGEVAPEVKEELVAPEEDLQEEPEAPEVLEEEPDEYTEHEYLEKELSSLPENTLELKVQEQLQTLLETQLEPPLKKSKAKDLGLECHDCGNFFKSKCKLKVHWFKVHLKAYLTCKICGKAFSSFKMLRDHKVNKTKKCLTLSQVNISGEGKSRIMHCRECDYSASNVKTMTLHLEKHTGDAKMFICKLCPTRYLYNVSLKLHMEQKHGEKKIEKTCTICREVILGRRRYRQHLIQHRNTSVLCTICNKLVKKYSYQQHIMIVHSNERNYCCDQCGAAFKGPSALHVHKTEVHRKENKIVCNRCGYSNSSQYKMNNHLQKHTDDQDFPCNVCGIFLPNNKQLNLHKKLHIARNYKCPHCNDKYFRMDSLRKHINNVHLKHADKDQKDFLLNNLEVSFEKKRFVKNHKCPQCEARYCRKSSLEKHVKRVH